MNKIHLEVLKNIKEECKNNNGYCDNCMLNTFCNVNGNIKGIPASWDLDIYESEENK